MLDKCEAQLHGEKDRQRHPSCRKHQLWVYKPVLVRLVPSSLNPALSAAATSACAKVPLVKMESSEELPTLDLWLEKLRSSSDAEPHPFTIEPKNKCRALVSGAHLIFFVHLKFKDPLNTSFLNRKPKVHLTELGTEEKYSSKAWRPTYCVLQQHKPQSLSDSLVQENTSRARWDLICSLLHEALLR